ncbi:BMP family ABC transporter substrate-binding protein [Colwellia echini]|uniref:BMP family ABC transporter substrate-binding protein n=1 Tax=Colwellia echini TaxID=1982103 RepID=A0ABY3MZY6_9GAMM|nr:BMP family ABC transporter substrate-binding protein [Colwellia echini]TYK66639.1 BMP family ABC transporter substrate-binding protein [Colwellia echini]
MKHLVKTLAMSLALTTSLGAIAKDTIKVGFVYVSPTGEAGWTYTHDEARKHVEKKFGDKVSTTYVESVAEGADSERVIRQLAKKGHDLIFTTSFGYMNPTIKVAKRYPNIKFEHATGYKQAKNVGVYFDRMYESRYLSGVIAAHMSKSNIAGFVASFPIPEVLRSINAFTLGFKSVKPDAKVKVVWVNSWFDPGKEREASDSLIDQGADVITQHTDSPAPVQAAEAAGIYAIGSHSDMSEYGKNAHLTAVIHNFNEFYEQRVQEVLDGTWQSENVWGGLNTGMTRLGEFNEVIPENVIADVEVLTTKIASGELHPFAGPLKNQAGEIMVPAGEIPQDSELLKMNYLVDGVEGKLN